tara:strand:+ start:3072 stop:3314 length:243 start_codon:yes stop_codon:yes gene_type:complete
MNVEVHKDYPGMDEDLENLEKINKSALIRVIIWSLRDLNSWATNKGNESAREEVRNICAMLLEAIRYQIRKEVQNEGKNE